MQILVLPSVFTQMPVQASHHMAKVPGFTTSRSISSFSHVPHCGKVLSTHDSLVISSTFAMRLSLCVQVELLNDCCGCQAPLLLLCDHVQRGFGLFPVGRHDDVAPRLVDHIHIARSDAFFDHHGLKCQW